LRHELGDEAPVLGGRERRLPKIIWPQQPMRIREACGRHDMALPANVRDLLALATPPLMAPQVAQAFLRCFYAVRDLERAERDLRDGGVQTEAFAARAMDRRLAEVRRRLEALAAALAQGA
jgi:hypothetical protein